MSDRSGCSRRNEITPTSSHFDANLKHLTLSAKFIYSCSNVPLNCYLTINISQILQFQNIPTNMRALRHNRKKILKIL